MHARPQVAKVLVAKRMKRWFSIARCPLIDPRCKPARARRNFLRLLAKHPDIGADLGLTVISVYE